MLSLQETYSSIRAVVSQRGTTELTADEMRSSRTILATSTSKRGACRAQEEEGSWRQSEMDGQL